MDNNQKFLAALLSFAIWGKKPQNIEACNIDWFSVYNEAKAHQIHGILFPLLKELDDCIRPDDEIMGQWTKYAFITGYFQTIQIENIARVLNALNESNIPAICLKGLVLRDLYPQPSLRSMSDADILIHWENFEQAKKILFSMGYYTKTDSNPKEVRFYHDTHMMIELHWLLIEPGYIKNSEKFEKSVWTNQEKSALNNVPIYILSPEDHVIYLFLHMVMHIKYSGFGLRQLCDLVLLIESKREVINWTSFFKRVKEFNIEMFVEAIFLVCKKLLDLEIPVDTYSVINDDAVVNSLIDDIFSSGVFGRKTSTRFFMKKATEHLDEESDHFPSKVNLYMRNIFPTGKLLADRYKYAQKYNVLIPVAWIHRFIFNLTDKNFINNVISRFKVPKGTEKVYIERVRLLKSLGLRKGCMKEQDK